MKALNSDHTGCAILIYDLDGNHIGSTSVTSHDRKAMRIEVKEIPHPLSAGSGCTMLILTSPAPCEYQGRILGEGNRKIIAMYRGRERENRGAVRYKISSPALIENLIYDGKAYRLHTPLRVELINISKSGVRFRSQNYALSNRDRFQMRLKISDGEKLLIADVVHHIDQNAETTEYGCCFLVGRESAV